MAPASRKKPGGRPNRAAGPDRLAEAVGLLERGVGEVLDGEGFRRYLALAGRFHRYSARNCLLILAQRPNASRVAGYRAWQQMGRQVRKGERGIRILAPVTRRTEDEGTGEEVRALAGFRVATVFDVSQTDGEPLPEAPAPEALDAAADPTDTAARIARALEGLCRAESIALEERELGPGHYGSYDRQARRIVLAGGLSEIDRATTLAHELAHHLLHEDSGERDRPAEETEAEGASFALFSCYGLDTGRFSFAYVARYAERPEVLAASLERIQGAVRRLIGAVEGSGKGTGGAVLMAATATEGRAMTCPSSSVPSNSRLENEPSH
jgi:hypothetical protein